MSIDKKVLLVNPNLMRPPIAPMALGALAAGLRRRNIEFELLDLAFAENPLAAIGELDGKSYLLAAITIRNIDDSMFPGSTEILQSHKKIVDAFRDAGFITVGGGAGFSSTSRTAGDYLGFDHFVLGDGESALAVIASGYRDGDPPPHGAYRGGEPQSDQPPAADRELWRRLDLRRYNREGGQVGVEFSRGCPHNCLGCFEPLSKGRRVRIKPPAEALAEIDLLIEAGVEVFHTCDCEFNASPAAARDICRILAENKIGEKIRWYAYCSPVGFDRELARLMARAGCAGVNFSADHGDERMMKKLRLGHKPADIGRIVADCRAEGLRTMLDLLFGAPGETLDSIKTTVDLVRKANPVRAGASVGLRLYPQTGLVDELSNQPLDGEGFYGEDRPTGVGPHEHGCLRPLYYIEPKLGPSAAEQLGEYIGDDRRFFHAASSHNYNNNLSLAELISGGERGAYWDILARAAGD